MLSDQSELRENSKEWTHKSKLTSYHLYIYTCLYMTYTHSYTNAYTNAYCHMFWNIIRNKNANVSSNSSWIDIEDWTLLCPPYWTSGVPMSSLQSVDWCTKSLSLHISTWCIYVPSGKHTKSHWKWSFLVDDYPLKLVIFHSYVSLPEGNHT